MRLCHDDLFWLRLILYFFVGVGLFVIILLIPGIIDVASGKVKEYHPGFIGSFVILYSFTIIFGFLYFVFWFVFALFFKTFIFKHKNIFLFTAVLLTSLAYFSFSLMYYGEIYLRHWVELKSVTICSFVCFGLGYIGEALCRRFN